MKIQIWKRKNKNKNKNYIYIRYRFSQKKAYVESLNLWEWVSPTNQNEKKHNEEIKKSYLETKRRKEDDLENKRLTVYNKSETKIYFKKVFFDLCYSNNVKSVYKLLLLCDKNINTLRLNEVVKRKYLKSLKEKWENLNEIINAKESTLIKYWESFKSTLKKAHKEGLCEYPNIDNIKLKEAEYEVVDGKIKLNKRFSSPGIKKIYGYLFFDNNGNTDSLLVDTQFYVIPKPNEAIVSPVNMQVFYIGLRNEIAVAFPGIADLTSIRVDGKNRSEERRVGKECER